MAQPMFLPLAAFDTTISVAVLAALLLKAAEVNIKLTLRCFPKERNVLVSCQTSLPMAQHVIIHWQRYMNQSYGSAIMPLTLSIVCAD